MTTPEDPNPKPWAQRPGETAKAYSAFLTYLNLGRSRSIAKAVEATGEKSASVRYWEKWSSKNAWVERSGSYDSDLLLEKVEGRKEEQESGRQRAVDHIDQLMGVVLGIANGTMPDGDKQVVCDRSGKPQTAKIEGAFGVPIEVAITKSLVAPRDRLRATELALGIAGIVVVKKQIIAGEEGNDLRHQIRHSISALPADVRAGMAAAAALGVEEE